MVIFLSWFGIISLMIAVVPVVAISPILLYIGMLIGAQSFQETPRSHAPAIILSLVAVAYLGVAAVLYRFARFAVPSTMTAPLQKHHEPEHDVVAPLA